ncbi:MAG: IS3 family transposase [Luteibacter sp.]
MKYAFIERHACHFAVATLCRVLKVSRSGFYGWQHRAPSQHLAQDAVLAAHVRRIHTETHEAYGARKVWKALQAQGIACGRHRIARLRRDGGIEARRRRRAKAVHYARRNTVVAPDRVRRCFHVDRPNLVWVGDVTFVPTRGGWLYLATLLDLYARRVVGWSLSNRNDQALVRGALEMAIARRQPAAGLIHHTDRGVLYSCKDYRALLARHGILPSMSRPGNCHDNACAESFFSSLKNELTHGQAFANHDLARMAIVRYIEGFYNRRRLHQTLGYRTPVTVDDEARSA